jgi:hypothetical protein
VKERRGAVGRATGIAESVAAAVRRRQQARLPRILLYDHGGEPELLRADAAGYDEVLSAAELMVELIGEEAAVGEALDDPLDEAR